MRARKPYDAVKRVIDFVVAATALVLLSPVMFLTAVLVRWRLGSPVVFQQIRPGLDGQPFTCLKFRSMTDARGADGALLPDDVRLTGFGKLLRATSLDELPQLLSVVKGDMSLVGPRPLLMEYLPLYSAEHARRHEVRPGITGYAQVNGRNAVSWEERLGMDVFYVDNRSFVLDCQIILKSVLVVVMRRGISSHGTATMPRFEGSKGAKNDTST